MYIFLDAISVRYGGAPAPVLDRLSLYVCSGEIAAVVGLADACKTLFRYVGRRPDGQGRVFVGWDADESGRKPGLVRVWRFTMGDDAFPPSGSARSSTPSRRGVPPCASPPALPGNASASRSVGLSADSWLLRQMPAQLASRRAVPNASMSSPTSASRAAAASGPVPGSVCSRVQGSSKSCVREPTWKGQVARPAHTRRRPGDESARKRDPADACEAFGNPRRHAAPFDYDAQFPRCAGVAERVR